MPGSRSFGVLSRSPAFSALFLARSVSLLGDGIGSLALVVHVQATRGTGTAVALLLLAASLPRLLSPVSGTLSDRVDRRLVLGGAELGQAAVLAVAVVWLPPLPVLLALLLVKGGIVAVSEPAGTSAVPQLVDDDDLPAANALLGGLRQAGAILGPPLGGVVVALGGVRAGLAVDASTFLVSLPLLARIPRLPPGGAGYEASIGGSVLDDAWASLRYTLVQPLTRALAIGFFFMGLAAGDDVALPFLARSLGAGERGIGALYAAVGAGLAAGYLGLSRRRRWPTAAAGLVLGSGPPPSATCSPGSLRRWPPRWPSRSSGARAWPSTRPPCRRRCSGPCRATCSAGVRQPLRGGERGRLRRAPGRRAAARRQVGPYGDRRLRRGRRPERGHPSPGGGVPTAGG